MNQRAASRLAWGLFLLGVAVFSVAAWLSLKAHAGSHVLPFLPALLVFSGVGALVSSRRPENPLGWLMLSFAAVSIGLIADAYARYGLTRSPPAAGTAWAAWVNMISIEVSLIPLFFILLLFPHGQLLSPRWRTAAWAAVAIPLVGGTATAVADVNFSAPTNFPMLRDPVQLLPRSAVSPVYSAYQFASLVLLLLAAACLILRFGRSRGEERQQLKWIAFAGLAAATGFIVLAFLPGPEPVLAFIALVPLIAIAAGIAILKYRLYDIDLVINKTLVYGSLGVFITGVYVTIVVGIGSAVGSHGRPNFGLSILATAVVAVAFQPVRERVQRLANRLVYGKRATPYEVLSEFSGRMAEAYTPEEFLPRMASILAEGTGASRADVWLKVGSRLQTVASWPREVTPSPPLPLAGTDVPLIPGADRAVPVRYQGEILGSLSIAKRPGEPLTPTEDKLVSDLASQAGLVLRNVRLTEELLARLEELRASRQRIVSAQDTERRRIERNIHDGAQQQLVGLAVKLSLTESLIGRDGEKERLMLAQLQAEAEDALENLRDLARGIYPPLLADQGLAAALEVQSRKAPVLVAIQTDGLARYPQEAEAAVYFCSLEALQNVGKYAGVSKATVRLVEQEGHLTFEVTDDGAGFDTTTSSYGTGLQGMADRLSALGGELQVHSAPGMGTTVTGWLPVRALESGG